MFAPLLASIAILSFLRCTTGFSFARYELGPRFSINSPIFNLSPRLHQTSARRSVSEDEYRPSGKEPIEKSSEVTETSATRKLSYRNPVDSTLLGEIETNSQNPLRDAFHFFTDPRTRTSDITIFLDSAYEIKVNELPSGRENGMLPFFLSLESYLAIPTTLE